MKEVFEDIGRKVSVLLLLLSLEIILPFLNKSHTYASFLQLLPSLVPTTLLSTHSDPFFDVFGLKLSNWVGIIDDCFSSGRVLTVFHGGRIEVLG